MARATTASLAAALLCAALLAPQRVVAQPAPTAPLVLNPLSLAAGVPAPLVEYGGGVRPDFRFVRVKGTQLTASDDNAPFYYLGANYWEGMSLGAAGPSGNRSRLRADLDALVAAGVTQLRVLGAAEGPDSEPWRIVPSLQPCPGVYNPDVLSGFDFLIAEMGARRMRATVVLGDEWAWSGGHAQYVRWAQAASSNGGNVSVGNASACVPAGLDAAGKPRVPDITNATWRSQGFQNIPYPGPGGNSWDGYQTLAGQFYGLPVAQRMWRDHVSFITSHVNPFTGLAHRDDPTIMAWQLANEPRAANGTMEGAQQYVAWIADASSFVKAAAPRQLVSTGMEGDTSYFSPVQALLRTQNATAVDYATSHLWVQNWGLYAPGYDDPSFVNATLPFARAYIAAQAATAAAIGKPLVLEEFGFPRELGSLSPAAATTRRDAYYAAVFDTLLASAGTAGVLAGVNFWAYAGGGRPAALGVPATRADLCGGGVSGGNASVTFSGGAPNWAACFTDQSSRGSSCGRDTWWATRAAWPPGAYIGQDTFLGDPPHESQGWYSVYDTDSTMDVVKSYTKQLNNTLACAAAAVRTAKDPSAAPGSNAGALACTASIAPGRAGNLC